MTDFGTTPLSDTTLSSNQFPVSAAFVPGTSGGNLTAVEGILVNTDGSGFKSTAIRMGLKDGDSVTLGSKADAKSVATDTTAITIMQVLKQISYQAQNPASTPVTGTFWQATQPVSGTVTANAGTNMSTASLALETGGNLATLAGGVSSSLYQTNLSKVGGNSIAVGNNAVPVLNSAATGYVSAYGSNASALTSATDYAFKWGSGGSTQVNHIMLQNNTATALNWDLDVTATAGSPVLNAGATLFIDVQTTVLHLYQAGTPNVNGTSASNIVVRGWL